MLTKMIDGIETICSKEEEKQIRAKWLLADKYPEYLDSIRYDGASMPYVDMDRAKELHMSHVNLWKDNKIADLTSQIEIAREDGNDDLEKKLLAQRKLVRNTLVDLSSCKTLDDLKALLPQ